jgi:hypothetical protein
VRCSTFLEQEEEEEEGKEADEGRCDDSSVDCLTRPEDEEEGQEEGEDVREEEGVGAVGGNKLLLS